MQISALASPPTRANPTLPWNRRERETTLHKLNKLPLVFPDLILCSFFFFSIIGKEVERWWEITQKDVGRTGATTSFIAPWWNN
jgi:hypothetical protein